LRRRVEAVRPRRRGGLWKPERAVTPGALEKLASGEASPGDRHARVAYRGRRLWAAWPVIIDEQHRFGVEQRARLRARILAAHAAHDGHARFRERSRSRLTRTSDISTIDELPPGRTPIETFAVRTSRLSRVYDFVRKNVAEGRQAYIVAPAIEEGENALTSAIAEAERLRRILCGSAFGIAARASGVTRRRSRSWRALFAASSTYWLTTVVEVGVDVANATVMVVLDAHRYGLAQLHQLRGRVGRGAAKSFCIFVYPDDTGSERLES